MDNSGGNPSDSTAQQFCLRWHNHQTSLLSSLPLLLDQSLLTDVTLSAEGRTVRAHRVVLSACSTFFGELFRTLEPPFHPVIVLPGASFGGMVALLTFMYSGEVNVFEEQIPGLLALAETLGVKGLADFNGQNNAAKASSSPKCDSPVTNLPDSRSPSPVATPQSAPATLQHPKIVSPLETLFAKTFQFCPTMMPNPLNFPPSVISRGAEIFARYQNQCRLNQLEKTMAGSGSGVDRDLLDENSNRRPLNLDTRKSATPGGQTVAAGRQQGQQAHAAHSAASSQVAAAAAAAAESMRKIDIIAENLRSATAASTASTTTAQSGQQSTAATGASGPLKLEMPASMMSVGGVVPAQTSPMIMKPTPSAATAFSTLAQFMADNMQHDGGASHSLSGAGMVPGGSSGNGAHLSRSSSSNDCLMTEAHHHPHAGHHVQQQQQQQHHLHAQHHPQHNLHQQHLAQEHQQQHHHQQQQLLHSQQQQQQHHHPQHPTTHQINTQQQQQRQQQHQHHLLQQYQQQPLQPQQHPQHNLQQQCSTSTSSPSLSSAAAAGAGSSTNFPPTGTDPTNTAPSIAESLSEKTVPPKPSNSKLYATCFICHKQLSNQYNLRVHLETHQNVRYACEVCSHVSRSKDALRKHVSYRHPGAPSPCETEAKRKRSKAAAAAVKLQHDLAVMLPSTSQQQHPPQQTQQQQQQFTGPQQQHHHMTLQQQLQQQAAATVAAAQCMSAVDAATAAAAAAFSASCAQQQQQQQATMRAANVPPIVKRSQSPSSLAMESTLRSSLDTLNSGSLSTVAPSAPSSTSAVSIASSTLSSLVSGATAATTTSSNAATAQSSNNNNAPDAAATINNTSNVALDPSNPSATASANLSQSQLQTCGETVSGSLAK